MHLGNVRKSLKWFFGRGEDCSPFEECGNDFAAYLDTRRKSSDGSRKTCPKGPESSETKRYRMPK
jgi:hypothetical protein